MSGLVREAMAAGAIGLGSSTGRGAHRRGRPARGEPAGRQGEFLALTRAMGESGRGLFQARSAPRRRWTTSADIWRASGRPVIWAAFFQRDDRPEYVPERLAATEAFRARGRRGAAAGLVPAAHHGLHDEEPVPVRGHARVAARDGRAGVALARRHGNPAFRAALKADLDARRFAVFRGRWDLVQVLRVGAARAQGARGRDPGRARPAHGEASGRRLARSGHRRGLGVEFLAGLLNTDDRSWATSSSHPLTLITLSDAGAHLSLMCDAGYSSTLLGKWVRGLGRLSLEAAVKRLSDDPARAYRIPGRGRLAPGYWADVAVFDPAAVDALPPSGSTTCRAASRASSPARAAWSGASSMASRFSSAAGSWSGPRASGRARCCAPSTRERDAGSALPLLYTHVMGSHGFPAWFWTALDKIKAGEYGRPTSGRPSTTPPSSPSATRSARAST